jgi:hypothetical protein
MMPENCCLLDDRCVTVLSSLQAKTQPVWKGKLRSVSKTFRDVGL